MLFINSPTNIGADTWIHLLLMRHLPRTGFALHAAVQPAPGGAPETPVVEAIRAIPGVALKYASFGPSLFGLTRLQKLRTAGEVVPSIASMLGLAAYIRRERIEVLHATDRPRDALACVLLARLTGAKALIHVHVKFDQWMSRGQKWALGQADMLVGVSEFVAESLRLGGYDGARIRAVLNAIEPSDWDPSSSPGVGRAALGVAPDAPLIVSVSRLFSWKGHADLLRALALVKRELPAVRLAIVGGDYPEGSGVTRDLSKQADALGLSENVLFTGHRRDVASLMAACDVFALPSFEEPFGLVYTEAMAMKKPVIALRNGGAPEVVSHGENGLLSPPKDDAALAANLLTLLRDPALRARYGANGRESVEARFSPARLASDFGALYTQLAG
ncbi:MAG TPA: glycosyltransferase family 4 protein [Polyangiales bacterium]